MVNIGVARGRLPKLPSAEVYNRVETTAILVSLAVFVALFVWFSFLPAQRIFQYYLFAVMVTLLFCGVLKAVGVAQRAGLALGGAIVIFGVILYITDKTFHEFDDEQQQITQLTNQTGAEKDQNAQLRARLDKLVNQDITVYTFRVNEDPLSGVIVRYLSTKGITDARRNGVGYVIPLKELLSGNSSIRVVVDPSSVPPERERAVRQNDVMKIDRIRYRIEPLELSLYLIDEETPR